MSFELYAAFIATTVALMALPGPNAALISANSIAYGRRYGLITVVGTSAAMIPQLLLTALGMNGALTLTGEFFEWIRWAGVAYLVYLGIQAWRAPAVDLTKIKAEPQSGRSIFLRGFLVSSSNPKTLLFYGAFFPQFVVADGNVMRQLLLLSLSFLAVAVVLDSCWALLADKLRRVLAARGAFRNRLTGTIYFAAAAGLAGVRRAS